MNQAAKTSCLNKLNTVTCADFNATTYDDDCDLVCTGTSTGAGGTGGSGTGGMGGTSGGMGGTSGATCGSVQPCGGSLVGTWMITGVCVNPPTTTNPNCPAATLTNLSVTESGTLSFAAGGTYTANISATISYTDMTPASCVAPATCTDLPAEYAALGATATCSGSTVCTCMVALASNGAETGTYTTSGTSVTVTPAGGEVDTMGYCVQGNTLHFLSFNGAGQVTSEEIAVRQ